jgi:hypothetical protein
MANQPTIPDQIVVLPTRGAPGFMTTDHVLVLQRRGVTTNLEAGVPLGSVKVEPRGGEWLAHVSNAAGYKEIRVIGLDRAIAAAAELATRLVGYPVRPAPFVAAYMHGWDAKDGADDRIVSPLRYEPSTDTVRIVATNACAAVFDGGNFDGARTFTEDPGSEPAWRYVDRALNTGFHECDRTRGDAYCKRRLAWLAGALWLEESATPLTCGVLTREMERVR